MKNTNRVSRKFSGRVTDMLHGIASITDAAIEHVSGLSEEDTSITTASLGNLRRRISELRDAILAADNSAGRREQQAAVRRSARMAAEELASLKTFLEARFREDEERRDELLQKLGFSDLYRDAVHRGRHRDMGALLTRVAGNLDGDTEAALVLAGLPGKRVDSIRKLAAEYHDHTTGGESGRGRQREYTEADVTAMNAIYAEVMAVAKVARRHFKREPATRSRFVMSKMLVNNGAGKKQPDDKSQHPAA